MASSNISKKLDEMSYRLVIMMRGLDSEKREIASKLSQLLKCPIFDVADIISSLHQHEEDHSRRIPYIEDLAMKIVRKMSSIQLSMKLNVIINNVKLSRREHFDDLMILETSEGARLLVLQCVKAQSQG